MTVVVLYWKQCTVLIKCLVEFLLYYFRKISAW